MSAGEEQRPIELAIAWLETYHFAETSGDASPNTIFAAGVTRGVLEELQRTLSRACMELTRAAIFVQYAEVNFGGPFTIEGATSDSVAAHTIVILDAAEHLLVNYKRG